MSVQGKSSLTGGLGLHGIAGWVPREAPPVTWVPAAMVVGPLLASGVVWYVMPPHEQGLTGFITRAPMGLASTVLMLAFAVAAALVATGAFAAGRARGPLSGLLTIRVREFQLASSAIGTVGVGWVYVKATGGSPAGLVRLWVNQEFWRFGDEYIAYGPGIATARYGAILAGGIALQRVVQGRQIGALDWWALAVLFALVMATSRISALMALTVAAAMVGFSHDKRVNRTRVICVLLAVIAAFGAATFSRGADFYRARGVDNPLQMAGLNAQAYLATPTDVTLQLTNAAWSGEFQPPGGWQAALLPLIPSYLPDQLLPGGASDPGFAGRNVETRYEGAVDVSLSLTTNSVLSDTLAVSGWWGLLSSIAGIALVIWLAGRFAVSGAVGAAVAGALLYGLLEFWRVYLFNSGGLHALVLLGLGAAAVGTLREGRSRPAVLADTAVARSGRGFPQAGHQPRLLGNRDAAAALRPCHASGGCWQGARRWRVEQGRALRHLRIAVGAVRSPVGLAFASRVGVLLAGLVTAIVTARALSPDGRGAWVLVGLIGAIPGLAAKGLSQAVAYDIGRLGGEGRGKQRDVLRASWWTSGALVASVGGAATVVAGIWSQWAGWGAALGLCVVGALAISGWLLAVPSGAALASGNMRAAGAQLAGPPVLAAFGLALAVSLGRSDLLGLAAGWASGTLLGSLLGIRRDWLWSGRPSVRPARLVARQASFTARAAAAGAINTAASRSDLVLLGVLGSTASVGVYSIAVTGAEMIAFIPWALVTANYGRLGRSAGIDARRLAIRLCRLSFVLAVAQGLLLSLAAEPLLAYVFGESYRGAGLYLWLLLPGTCLMASIAPMFAYMVNHLGRPQLSLLAFGVNAGVTGILCAVLVPGYDAAGAAAATSIGSAVCAFLVALKFVRAPEAPSE